LQLRRAIGPAAELEGETLVQRLRYAQTALLDAQVALQTDHTAARQKELGQKLSALAAELDALLKRGAQYKEALAREVQDAEKLQAALSADGHTTPGELERFILLGKEAKIDDLDFGVAIAIINL
jgi:hypothetical protein